MTMPTLTADGRAVRLPVTAHVTRLLDDLATAYADDPGTLGALLDEHAATVAAADHAEHSDYATDAQRAMAAAEADGTRTALCDELPADTLADPLLTPDEAISYGTCLTEAAAYIRTHPAQNRKTA